MNTSDKILSFENASSVLDAKRGAGKTIVQCHGTFDLVHPGHVYHLQEARTFGDLLVITLTAEAFVNKGPGRPYFNDHLRAHSLAALSCVDYVIVVPHATAVEAIRCVRPDIYCKGKEYEDPTSDVTGNIADDVRVVEEVGGVVKYVGSVVFSSTRLLNNHFDHLSSPIKKFCATLAEEFDPTAFRNAVESLRDLRVLVIGDTIIDRYSYVNVQGLTSKNRIISGRFLKEETQAGGALAVFRHVKQFASSVRFLSLVGTEDWVDPLMADHLSRDEDRVIRDPEFTTIVKQRFVEPLSDGKELSKLFAVNYIDAGPPTRGVREKAMKLIREEIKQADAVLLLDFGHGMMQEEIREAVQTDAEFLALNCQTNSNNHGFNIISRQYHRADVIALDTQELMLSSGHRYLDHPVELNDLRRHLGANYAWLTRGPSETIGLHADDPPCFCPALETEVTDTIGAGDAFFSMAALSAARKLPIELGTFLGQLAGAQAVKFVGNERPISKPVLLKSGMSLLNF